MHPEKKEADSQADLHLSPPSRFFRLAWIVLRWILVSLVCLWLAFCTAVGPLYRKDSTIAAFSWPNAVILIVTFLIYLGLVGLMVSLSLRESRTRAFLRTLGSKLLRLLQQAGRLAAKALLPIGRKIRSRFPVINKGDKGNRRNKKKEEGSKEKRRIFCQKMKVWSVRHTQSPWQIALVIGLFWGVFLFFIPSVFSADAISQWTEVNRWMWFLHGGRPSYSDSFNIADIYPIAHYLWPTTSTYLTNQHNIVLTLITGFLVEMSSRWTGSLDWGLIAASVLQALFALFCVCVTLPRFFRYCRPRRVYRDPKGAGRQQEIRQEAGPWIRLIVLLFFALNPLAVFSMGALTKSPVFAYAFLWWFGIWYQILSTPNSRKISPRTIFGLFVSSLAMLVSAKYAVYIIAAQIVLILICDRTRWKVWLIGLMAPLLIFQIGLNVAISTGSIINGDPIESRGVQVQQIARVMKLDPLNISPETKQELQPIFNLYAMGNTYFPNDADRVKSSGSDSKVETYKWKTVTAKDMEKFNHAWLALGRRNPVIYTDAMLAKIYGYFDVNDKPYTSVSYYLSTPQLDTQTEWLKSWFPWMREGLRDLTDDLQDLPLIGWIIRGNFYVVAALLLMGAELILRRWKHLLRQFPLLLLMGVMMLSPANNFDRHMLPVAFVFLLMAIEFCHETRRHRARTRRSYLM